MSEDTGNKQQSSSPVPTVIQLDTTTALDLAAFPESERKALLAEYTKGTLDLAKKAQSLNVDAMDLKRNLDNIVDSSRQAGDAGLASTATYVKESDGSRTEFIVGNTDEAQRGKITNRQAGTTDWTPFYIGAVILAVTIIVVAIAG